MFLATVVFAFSFSSVFVIAVGADLNLTRKCEVTDNECKREMYQTIFKQASIGIPQLHIPPADPIILINAVSTLPNSVKLTLEVGVATGYKNCNFDALHTSFEEPFRTAVNMTCDIEVNGDYKVEIPKSVMKELGGEDLMAETISGNGKGKITFNKLHFLIDVPFEFIWKDNDAYIHIKDVNFYHDANDTVTFSINNLDVGHKANGERIANYLKDKAVELNLMAPIIDKMAEFFKAFLFNYVGKYPAKDLYTSDLSSYM